jgi:hypothetical protein
MVLHMDGRFGWEVEMLKCLKWGRTESAGINRHRVGDERAPHKRRSCSIMAPSHVRVAARLHVMQLTGEAQASH